MTGETVGDIRKEVTSLKRRLDGLRPLTGPSLRALEDWFAVHLTYTSNAIEGGTLTESETALVLEKGLTVHGRPLRDHIEAVDHHAAFRTILDWVRNSTPPDGETVRHIHRMLFQRSLGEEAGQYARFQRRVTGSPFIFPSPTKIPALMDDFYITLRTLEEGPQGAFDAHLSLVSIHPFADGNGRTARLLMNLLLLRAGYPPASIGPQERLAYMEGLKTAQLENCLEPYLTVMYERLRDSLLHYVKAAAMDADMRTAETGPAPS